MTTSCTPMVEEETLQGHYIIEIPVPQIGLPISIV